MKIFSCTCNNGYFTHVQYFQTERRSAPDNINRSQVTHVIFLTRFAPPTSSAPEMVSFEAHICNLLEEAPHRTLPLKILQEKLVWPAELMTGISPPLRLIIFLSQNNNNAKLSDFSYRPKEQ